MALTLGDNFSYQGAKPLDARLKYDTLANMKAVADATMYDGCLAYCVATDKTYQWKSTNTVDESTGRWREFETGGGGGGAGSDTTAYHTSDTSFTALADADFVPVYDTSASVAKKSTWSNIKSVLKTYFDTLYNKVTAGTGLSLSSNTMSIKQFASGDMDEVIPELPSVGARYHQYSTEEQVIGRWLDGSILYEKTFTGTLPTSTTGTFFSSTLSDDISSTCTVVGFDAYMVKQTAHTRVMNGTTMQSASDIKYTEVYINSTNNVNYRTIVNYGGYTFYVTVRYLKTT